MRRAWRRESPEQGVSSVFAKGITPQPVIPLLEAVGTTGEKEKKHTEKETNPLPKRTFFSLFILSVKASDAFQMGQDLIFLFIRRSLPEAAAAVV